MNIKEFVSDSLVQICEAVLDAQEKTSKSGARVNPYFRRAKPEEAAQVVKFDLAVTVSQQANGKAGGEIKILGASLGGGGELATSEQTISRIKFEIPIDLPRTTKDLPDAAI
jgi:hypothetical protein